MFGLPVYFISKFKIISASTCLLTLLTMASLYAQANASNENSLQEKLKKYTWQNRVVLVIADTKTDSKLKQQQNTLSQQQAQLQDRDLEVLYLPLNEINQADKTFLINQFSIQEKDFCAILIGKDGGEKLRSDKPLQIENLFGTIDAMPMRKQEMKGNNEL